jgi:hypothetical protein
MSKRVESPRRERSRRQSLRKAVPSPLVPRPDDTTGVNDRLARVLDTPHLAQVVPRLAPEVLHHLIRQRGLDACAALVAAATPAQVAAILDLDLWRPAPGRDDRFDGERFGSWLETLMDEGEAVAARVVAAMDRDLAIVGLSRYVRVFDPGVLSSIGSSDDDPGSGDVLSSGRVEAEVGGYVVRAKTAQRWDALVGLLVTLADEYPDCFNALMQGCRQLSNSTPEPDGFHELMLEPDQLLHDVSLDREHRREQQGHLTPGDARAFLQMARQPRPHGSTAFNAIAAACFRALDGAAGSGEESARPAGRAGGSSIDRKVSATLDAVADLLAEAGVSSTRPRALLGPVTADVARLMPIQSLIEHVHDTDSNADFARSRELAFVANALLAGCSVYSRPFTTQEAWNAAVSVCNLGLELLPSLPETFLVDHDLVTAFEAGWRLLHEDVGMFVAQRLIATLADLRGLDTATERDLHLLRRELERNRDRGTPWRAASALDVIAILDMPTWACLCGLLSECPVLPAALTAIVEGRTHSVSATAFESFGTTAQIRKVHDFAEKLRDVLLP